MNGSDAMQLMPDAAAPMAIHLLMAFELAGVELSPTFSVSYLELRAQRGRMRVVLPRQTVESGITFATAQILLDRTARIGEILLGSVAV